MPDPEDDNPRRVRSVENHIGIRSHHRPADIALIGETPGIRVICEQSNHGLELLVLDVVGTLRRTSINLVENFRQAAGAPDVCSGPSQPMLRPDGADLFVRRKLPIRGFGERSIEVGGFLRR